MSLTARHVLLAFALGVHPAALASICDAEIKPVAALLRVLESGLKLRELDADMIDRDILGPQISNPFLTKARDPENLALRQTFDRYWRKLRADHHDLFRAQARQLAERERNLQAQVAQAQLDSKHLLWIEKEDTLPFKGARGEMTQGYHNGRPVFVGKFYVKDKVGFYTFDYTPELKRTYLRPLGDTRENDSESAEGKIFEWNGRSYFLRTSNFSTMDLATGEYMNATSDDWPYDIQRYSNLRTMQIWNTTVASTRQGIRIASTFRSQNSQLPSGLMVWDPTLKPEPNFRVDFNGRPTSTRTGAHVVNGETIYPYISTLDLGIVHFFNLSADSEKFATLDLGERRSFTNAGGPLPYTLNGEKFAVVPFTFSRAENIANGVQRRVGIFSLDDNRLITDLQVKFDPEKLNAMEFVETSDGPLALLNFGSGFSVINLKTHETLWELDNEEHALQFFKIKYGLFRWKGLTYILLGTVGAQLQLRELSTGHLRHALKVPTRGFSSILTFEVDGVPKALVTESSHYEVLFFNLLGGEAK